MKYLKIIGLAAVAAMVLMAFLGAGTASATTLTDKKTNTKDEAEGAITTAGIGTVIHATATSTLTLHAGFANVTCTESTVKGKTTTAGSSSETVKGNIEELTFTNCGSFVVKVIKNGSLEIHTDSEVADGNGILTGSGSEVTTALGEITCTYGTNNTKIGTLKGSINNGGATATFAIGASLSKTAGGFLCANPAAWEGSYKVTTPDYLDVD